MAPVPIVMVHGAFCGAWVFDRFRAPFEAAGHQVVALDLRGHGPRSRPEAVVGLSMTDYARDVAAACAGLPEPPVLVGHSLGGLVAQMAASRAPVSGLALLAPSPPWGVAGSSVEEAVTAFGLHMLGAFWTQAVTPDPDLMRAYSLNRLPTAEREVVVARMCAESGRALWETLNWWLDPFMTTSVASGLKAPVLALAGERDVVHPPATVRQTAARLGARYEELPEMSHWLPAEPGWEGCANAILRWMTDEVRLSA
jgi:pimeloyl-ACP methyl ester carboxylesterase